MLEFRFFGALQFWNDDLSKFLAEFKSPLIKGINVPNHTLCVDRVLVERDKLP